MELRVDSLWDKNQSKSQDHKKEMPTPSYTVKYSIEFLYFLAVRESDRDCDMIVERQ